MARELLTSTKLAHCIKSQASKEELCRRIDRILDPTIQYISLAVHGLTLNNLEASNKRNKGFERNRESAIKEALTSLSKSTRKDWINKPKKNESPFVITHLPRQDLITIPSSDLSHRKHVISHTMLHKKKFLEYGNTMKNGNFLHYITHVAAQLAYKEKKLGKQLTETEVLHAFAVSVALAQVFTTKGKIRDAVELNPDDIRRSPKVFVMGEEESPKIVRVQNVAPMKDKESKIKRAIRDQIIFYALGVFSLYGFSDVVSNLLHEKAVLKQ